MFRLLQKISAMHNVFSLPTRLTGIRESRGNSGKIYWANGRGNLGILGPMGIESVEKLGPAIFQNMRWDSISDKHTVLVEFENKTLPRSGR